MTLDRRGFLGASAAALAMSALPGFALAASSASDTRFLLVLLRGGMDGLHALQPVGDPAFAALRGDFAHAAGQPASHALDGDFALHGALGFMAQLHARRQLLPVVADEREKGEFAVVGGVGEVLLHDDDAGDG